MLSIIWKSDISNKIKLEILQVLSGSLLLYGFPICTLTIRLEKKLDGNYIRVQLWKTPGSSTEENNSCTVNCLPVKTGKKYWVLLIKWGRTHKRRFSMESNTWTHQCWSTSKNLHSSALSGLEDLPWVMANRDGWQKNESSESALLAWLDDDDCRTRKVWDESSILQFSVVYDLHNFGGNRIQSWCYQNIAKLLTQPSITRTVKKWIPRCNLVLISFKELVWMVIILSSTKKN